MKISIAMTTYNGVAYLRQQLDSFATQTLLPDELVICDDGSIDATLEILQEYAKRVLFSVVVHRNENRVGYAANFGGAIEKCSGDLIFLSDQDDFWFSTKIERVVNFFLENPNTWMVVNDAEITDESLNSTGLTVAGQLVSAGLRAEQLLLGCCMTFRSVLKPILLPIPADIHGHDGWINTLTNALGLRASLPDVLQYYRRHTSNTSSWATTSKRRAARWHLEIMKYSKNNRQIDTVIASDRRMAQINVLKNRLESHSAYLKNFLANEEVLDKFVAQLSMDFKSNEIRKSIQIKRFGCRFFSAIDFYRSGGYQQFEGLKSLAKDVIR